MTVPGDIRYADSGGASIAFRVTGAGPVDLLFVPGFVSHLELLWEEPASRRFFERLASFARLIMYDKREQGLSDRFGHAPSLADSLRDILAVLDAAGSPCPAVLGISEGGPLALLLAAEHPERVSKLVVYGTGARFLAAPDHPEGLAPEDLERLHREVREHWGGPSMLRLFAPTLADDARFRAWWARLLRSGTSPRGAEALFDFHRATDVRERLPAIAAPTLVLHRADDALCPPAWGRDVARRIAGARYVELPGEDHLWIAGEQDELLGAIEQHVTGRRETAEPQRVLRAVLFTDIVDSTRRASALGDLRWRDVLAAHDRVVRDTVERHGGRLVKHLGDGTLSAFGMPAAAIRAAVACRQEAVALGLELRAGLHAGEVVETADGDLAGLSVHIAARVGAAAGPGEVLVSGTVRDLVAGSGIGFAERGAATLRGLDGTWPLFAVAGEGRRGPSPAS